jgi:Na+-driven multidrug efflux pump
MGAGKMERAERATSISALVGFFFLSVLGIFMFLFAEGISAFFIPGETETIKSAALFLRFIALSFGSIGIYKPMLGAFRGAGNTISPMIFTIVLFWVIQYPLAYFLSKYTSFAEVGIWIAFPVASFVSAILIFIWFAKGSWKKKRIIEEIKVLEAVEEEAAIEGGI